MKNVTVKTNVLIEAIRTNRNTHHGALLEAAEDRRALAVKKLELGLAALADDPHYQPPSYIKIPALVDHLEDYDRVLAMLAMSIDETQTLTAHEFNRYVNDAWDWKDAFNLSTASYKDMDVDE